MMPDGYLYTFAVQCKEFTSMKVIATVRIEGNVEAFMKALQELHCDPERIKQIYVGEIDFETAPLITADKENDGC